MSRLRSLIWSLGLVLLAPAGAVPAAETPQVDQGQLSRPEMPLFALLERLNHLLVPGAQDKLNLTAQQLDQITKLQYEFRAKRRDMLIKMAHDLVNKCREKDAEGVEQFDVCQGALTVFTDLLRIRGLRDDFEAKARDLLTADQKKQYVHLESEWLRRFSERRAQRVQGGEWDVFLTSRQQSLKLTAEQRQKLGQLYQDMDSKLKTILTKEQYQRLQTPHPRQLRQPQ